MGHQPHPRDLTHAQIHERVREIDELVPRPATFAPLDRSCWEADPHAECRVSGAVRGPGMFVGGVHVGCFGGQMIG